MGLCGSRQKWGAAPDDDVVDIDYVMRHARPGDIVMHRGRGLDGAFIRFMGADNQWTHASVVLRLDPLDLSSPLMLAEDYPTVIGPDMYRDGSLHTGVQVTDLRTRLETYEGNVAWRPMIQVTEHPDFVERQVRLKNYLSDLPVPIQYMRFDPRGLARLFDIATADVSDHDNRNMEVCNTTVAHILWRLGIIEVDHIYEMDNVTLACLGSTFGHLPFAHGWSYGDTHKIVRPWRDDEASLA